MAPHPSMFVGDSYFSLPNIASPYFGNGTWISSEDQLLSYTYSLVVSPALASKSSSCIRHLKSWWWSQILGTVFSPTLLFCFYLDRWFLNFSMHKNHLGSLLKHKFLDSTPGDFWLEVLGQGSGFAFLMSSQLMLMLPVRGAKSLLKMKILGPPPRATESDSLRKDPENWVLIKSPNDSYANQSLRCTVPLELLSPGYILKSLGKLLKYSEAQASLLESSFDFWKHLIRDKFAAKGWEKLLWIMFSLGRKIGPTYVPAEVGWVENGGKGTNTCFLKQSSNIQV